MRYNSRVQLYRWLGVYKSTTYTFVQCCAFQATTFSCLSTFSYSAFKAGNGSKMDAGMPSYLPAMKEPTAGRTHEPGFIKRDDRTYCGRKSPGQLLSGSVRLPSPSRFSRRASRCSPTASPLICVSGKMSGATCTHSVRRPARRASTALPPSRRRSPWGPPQTAQAECRLRHTHMSSRKHARLTQRCTFHERVKDFVNLRGSDEV